jgi:hypothetical protein
MVTLILADGLCCASFMYPARDGPGVRLRNVSVSNKNRPADNIQKHKNGIISQDQYDFIL